LSTICKNGTKNDETVSQTNVVMVGIDSLLTFGENAHAQPHLAVYLWQLCTCGQRWDFLCSVTAAALGGRLHQQQQVKITIIEQFVAAVSTYPIVGLFCFPMAVSETKCLENGKNYLLTNIVIFGG